MQINQTDIYILLLKYNIFFINYSHASCPFCNICSSEEKGRNTLLHCGHDRGITDVNSIHTLIFMKSHRRQQINLKSLQLFRARLVFKVILRLTRHGSSDGYLELPSADTFKNWCYGQMSRDKWNVSDLIYSRYVEVVSFCLFSSNSPLRKTGSSLQVRI